MEDTFTLIPNLRAEVTVPPDGILSRILYKSDRLNVTLFGFDAGQELSEHTAAWPAILEILDGEAELTLGDETRVVGPGAWIHMPARLPHSACSGA